MLYAYGVNYFGPLWFIPKQEFETLSNIYSFMSDMMDAEQLIYVGF
jgi:hypothetical protein